MQKLLSAILVTLALTSFLHAGTAYELKLGREIRPFDEYVISGYSSRIAYVRIREESGILTEVQHDTTTVRIKARCSVSAVTEDGQEAVKLVTIEQADVQRRGKVKELLPAGTLVKAMFSDSGTFITQDGKPVDPDILADLVAVIRSEGGRKTSEIMDAKRKVKVKQKWSMDINAFKRTLDPIAQNTVKNIKGQVVFEKIDSISGTPVGVVSLKASAKDAISEMQGTKTSSSSLLINVSLTVPLDVRYPAMRVATTTAMFVTFGEGTGAAVVELSVNDDLQFQR